MWSKLTWTFFKALNATVKLKPVKEGKPWGSVYKRIRLSQRVPMFDIVSDVKISPTNTALNEQKTPEIYLIDPPATTVPPQIKSKCQARFTGVELLSPLMPLIPPSSLPWPLQF